MFKIAVTLALLVAGIAPAFALMPVTVDAAIPTLDDAGLIALASLVGVVGGYLARRRKK